MFIVSIVEGQAPLQKAILLLQEASMLVAMEDVCAGNMKRKAHLIRIVKIVVMQKKIIMDINAWQEVLRNKLKNKTI